MPSQTVAPPPSFHQSPSQVSAAFFIASFSKGLDEATGRSIVNEEAHYGADSVTLSPGPGGAHNWSPMSFNPATGLVYVPTTNGSSYNFALDQNFTYKPGQT